ncbi:MAG: hypothetical protein E7676_06460 [Ruminococcaceae bacterium]|nr:hypothetical protein [Oscillospiraceae bacterium]
MENKFNNENNDNIEEVSSDITSNIWTTYVPRFTEASENYHAMEDARLRAMLGEQSEASSAVDSDSAENENQIDPTAELDADFVDTDAKRPENRAVDEDATSINIYKFVEESDSPEEVFERTEEDELAEINALLAIDAAPTAKEEEAEPEIEVEVAEEEEPEPTIPDPDFADFGVYEAVGASQCDEDAPSGVDNSQESVKSAFGKSKEFTNPAERDSFKDKFLDSIISIKIRYGAAFIFAIALLALEILSAVGVISFGVFSASASTSSLAIIDFLLSTCIFVMALPELVRSVKYLTKKTVLPDLLPIASFLVLSAYTLAVSLSGAASYALFGFMFAVITLPVMNASLYRTKADFIAFKMIAQSEEKGIIDKKDTRELEQENMALDGLVDEYKSKTARTFKTSFISDFFKNSADVSTVPHNTLILFGAPLALGVVAGLVAGFVAYDFIVGITVFTLVFMLGCPAFAALSNKISFFHSQRAALSYESTAIGERAHHDFSGVDVFAFDDVDIFGPDDVNLKRFMLYGERDSMEKVMRQMCALFAAVGGPLDFMFSNAIDNRVRHKTATNVIVEDDGLCGDVMGHRIYAGSEDYMRRNNIAIPDNAVSSDSGIDTTKVMYAAEDGEVYAKFYIRYSFSEEFTMILPELREAGIIPLVYTRDPNISGELIKTLTAGAEGMRVVKLYNRPSVEEKVYPRVSARMVTYGDRIDAANMLLLSKKYRRFTAIVKFAELCAMIAGVTLAIVFSFIRLSIATVLVASIWHIVLCQMLRVLSTASFLNEANKKED